MNIKAICDRCGGEMEISDVSVEFELSTKVVVLSIDVCESCLSHEFEMGFNDGVDSLNTE